MPNSNFLNDTTELICGLKAIQKYLECQRDAFIKQDLQEPQPYITVPSYNDDKSLSCKPKRCRSQTSPRKLLKEISNNRECPTKYKSPEMKMSYLHYKCFCLHRNGLQDECPLTGCNGQPQCLVKPWAECPPGKYFRAKHPELYPVGQKTTRKRNEC